MDGKVQRVERRESAPTQATAANANCNTAGFRTLAQPENLYLQKIKLNYRIMPINQIAPTSTHVQESRVLPASPERVWQEIRPLTFAWLSSVKETKVTDGNQAEVGSHRKIIYKDGTIQSCKIIALSDLPQQVTWEVITSEPAITVSSVLHQIRLHHITHDNSTFIEWVTDFSNDATPAVVQDSKYKKQEAFEELFKSLSSLKRAASSPAKAPGSPKKVAK
eukprot:Partr_v1_DN27398_c1_g1_i1_m46294 putative Polyketide cyclase / dehydrase and lipid transport